MEQEHAFIGERENASNEQRLYTGSVEGCLEAPDYSIRVDNVKWSGAGKAKMLSDQFFLEWLMYKEEDIECAGPGRNFVSSHAVIFVPPGQEMHYRWKGGRIR